MILIIYLKYKQPQRSRSRRQTPTQSRQSNHQATLPPRRPCLQAQDQYRTKATLPHIWTKARTVLVLLWPNCYTMGTFWEVTVGLFGSDVVPEGPHLCDKSLFPIPLCTPSFWFKCHSQFPHLHSGGFTLWKLSVLRNKCESICFHTVVMFQLSHHFLISEQDCMNPHKTFVFITSIAAPSGLFYFADCSPYCETKHLKQPSTFIMVPSEIFWLMQVLSLV